MTPGLLNLPIELITLVVRELDNVPDLSALARSCRGFHNVLTPTLYQIVKDDPGVLCWACDEGQARTVEYLLAAGADPDVGWISDSTRASMLTYVRAFDCFYPPRKRYDKAQPVAPVASESKPPATDAIKDAKQATTDEDDDIPDEDHIEDYSEEDHDDDEADYIEDNDVDDDSGRDSDESSDDGSVESLSPDDILDDGPHKKKYYWSPIHIAVRWGHNDIIQLLVRYGADLNSISRGFCGCMIPTELPIADGDYNDPGVISYNPIWRPLHTAICYEQLTTANLLLALGASTNVSTKILGGDCMFTDDPYVTALHTACELGSVEMCGHLIDSLYQTNLEAKDHVGRTPLVYAYYNENWSCIDYLISMGATINTKCGPFSLFQHACNYGQFAEANRLLELGADIDVTFSTPGDETSSLACCCYGGRLERRNKLWNDRAERQSHLRVKVTQLLIDRKVDIEKGWKDSTPLMEAAASHLSELVELLLSAGADANVEDANSNSALVKACQSTSSSMPGPMLRTVLALLNCKPKRAQCRVALAALCNTKDLEHNTDRETAAQLLLDYAGNSSIARSVGQSLLASSIVNGNTGLAATWAGLGVKPTKKMIQTIARRAIETEFSSALEYVLDNFRGSAPLLLSGHLLLKALAAGSKLCAIVLLMRGSQFDVRSEEGETCLFLACQSKGTSLADMLLVRGADPNSCNDDGTYPLLPAIANENRKLIALLMKHGAMIHHDPSGLQGSPLDLAIMLGKANVVREIIAQEAYWDSTKQERSAHLRVACTNPAGHFEDEHILYTLINAGGVDIDSPIATGLFAATPLHFAIAAENNSAIKVLMKEGAKIHRKISGQPIERQPGTDSAGGAEDLIAGTTPMEFALKCGDVAIATMMMDDEEHTASSAHRYMLELDDVYVPWIEHTDDVPIVDYVKAVCHRHNQSLLARLLTRGISPNIQDAHGKTPIMLLCEAWDKHAMTQRGRLGAVASRIGKCIGMLFHNRVGANPSICDKKGKSGLDYIRQRMASTEVTDHWNDAFVIEGDSVKSLL